MVKGKGVHIGKLLTWLICVPLVSVGQENLILNSSFEELRWPNSEYPCPSSGGSIDFTTNWLAASGSVDYFNSCSVENWPDYGVPFNLYGHQVAFEDSAYAHFACYAEPWPDAREYLMQELDTALSQGQGYSIRFQVSLTDSCNYAISGIGALFTADDTRYWDDEDFFDVTPQIVNHQDSLLDDKIRWMEVSGQFVANGGEKFITIGCFKRDSELSVEQVSNHPETNYNWDFSSYYIDAVELYVDSTVGVVEHQMEYEKVLIYPNPSIGFLNVNFVGEMNDSYQLRLVAVSGLQVREQKLTERATTVDITDLSKGVYFVEIVSTANDELWRGKVVLID